MPPKKKSVPRPDERLRVGSPNEIRRRLSEFVTAKFDGNWTYFAETVGVPVPTASEWKQAKSGWPGFEHLWKLAENGLSIDWLVTGRLPMVIEYAGIATDAGRLLELLRPYAEQMSGVGEFTARQAFGHLLIQLGVEGMLKKAAEPFVPHYLEVKRDVEREDEADALRSWIYDQLTVLDKRVDAGDAPGVREALSAMGRRIEESIPERLRHDEAARQARQALLETGARRVEDAVARGWHPNAVTTAAEVAQCVEGAKAELTAVSMQLANANTQGLQRLAAVERSLSELAEGVARLQSRWKSQD